MKEPALTVDDSNPLVAARTEPEDLEAARGLSISRRALRNFSGQLAMLAVSFADRIIFTGILIRAWGLNQFSDWATILAASGLLMIAEFGFQVLLGNNLVRTQNAGQLKLFNRFVGTGLYFYAILSLIMLAGLGVAAAFFDLNQVLGLFGLSHANLVFLLLGTYSILRIARNGVTQVYRGRGEVHKIIWTEVRSQTAVMLGACAAVLAGAEPWLVAALYLGIEFFIGETWAVLAVRRRFPEVRLVPSVPRQTEVRGLASRLPLYGWLTGANGIMLHLPVLLLSWLGFGGAPLASLIVQRTLVNFGKTLSTAFSSAIGIEIADLQSATSAQEQGEAVLMLGRFNVALAALMFSGLFVFGKPIIAIWTGAQGLGSLWVLGWLLLPIALTGPAIPLQMLTFYSGQPGAQAIGSIVQIAVGIPVAIGFGRHYGVEGVAFGVAIGEVVGISMVLPALAAKRVSVRYAPVFFNCMGFFLLSLAWSGGCALVLSRLAAFAQPLYLGSAIVIWIVVAAIPVAIASVPRRLRIALIRRIQGIVDGRRAPP